MEYSISTENMKLNPKQILQIEKHLDFKELVQVDLRSEVLDHMASNIENTIQRDNLEFNEAFNAEIKLWNEDLKEYSSSWLGYAWVGPKLLMQKCVKEVKRMYLFSICLTAMLSAIGIQLTKVLKMELPTSAISNVLGIIYLLSFVLTGIGFYKMKVSKIQTTYRHIYKINTIGFSFMYLAFNPLWSDSFRTSLYVEDTFFGVLLHSFVLIFGYHSWRLYCKHFDVKKGFSSMRISCETI
jgi:hypothetical protein